MRRETPTARLDRLIHERVHDPYRDTHKPAEPSVCPDCNAVFRQGRWQWAESWPLDSHQVRCQACRRIRDDYPAGMVALSGGFLGAHHDEILALVRHQEAEERNQHVLHRIMGIEEGPNSMVVKTTDLHLPRRIGEALQHAFKGELDLHYDEGGCFLRAQWSRAA
jgi:hypothetical protein